MGNELDSASPASVDEFLVEHGEIKNKEMWVKYLAKYQDKLKEDPENTEYLTKIALALRKLREYDDTLSILNRLLKKDPKNKKSLLIDRGITYNMMRKYGSAIDDFSSAIKIDKNYVQAYYNRAASFYLQQKYKKAVQDYTHVIDHSSKTKNSEKQRVKLAQVYVRRGEVYEKWKKYDQAVKEYETAMDLDENLLTTIGQRCENLLVRIK